MNLARTLVAFVVCLSVSVAWAQPPRAIHFNHLLHQAAVLNAMDKTPEALSLYDSCLTQIPWAIWNVTEAADIALVSGDTARAINYLELLHERGGEPLVSYSEPVKGLYAQNLPASDRARLQRARKIWAARADSTWIKALIEMKELDQSSRAEGNLSMLKNDSINLQRLISMTEERGYPTPARVGGSAGIVDLLLWHHRGELSGPAIDRFWKMTEDAIAEGDLAPDLPCGFLDFADHEAGKPMRYGTLIYYFHQQGDIKLIDRTELNRNRASAGLESIEDFALIMGLDLDVILAH